MEFHGDLLFIFYLLWRYGAFFYVQLLFISPVNRVLTKGKQPTIDTTKVQKKMTKFFKALLSMNLEKNKLILLSSQQIDVNITRHSIL